MRPFLLSLLLLVGACAPVLHHTRALDPALAVEPAWSPAPARAGAGSLAQDLAFPCGESRCVGTLTTPAEGAGPWPAVVLAHGFTGERDMGLPVVAERLAQSGFAAFSFDYRGWGDSGGLPRYDIVAEDQIDDVRAALAFVRGRPEVDGARVALWGTSFGGGHVLAAAARDGQVAAVVAQVPMVNGLAEPEGGEKHDMSLMWPLFRLSMKDKLRSLRDGERLYVPAFPAPGEVGFIVGDEPRAALPTLLPPGSDWPNLVAPAILVDFDEYHPHREARDLGCPTLLVVAAEDHFVSNEATRALAAKMPRARLVEVPGGHFGVYAGEPLEAALAAQIPFLREALGVGEAAPAAAGSTMMTPISP